MKLLKDNLISPSGKTIAIAYIAVFAATLVGGKLALAIIPNVEIVTILILCYSTVFGAKYSVPATIIFCIMEAILYPFGSWVLLYFIYWPLLAFGASYALKKRKICVALIYSLSCTLAFGILSSLFDACIYSLGTNTADSFFKMFALYYVRGLWFYAFHLASSLAGVLILYKPLCKALTYVKNMSQAQLAND
ncbi:MAG: hypothetical protein RR248_00780 [Clostridia bacterium]